MGESFRQTDCPVHSYHDGIYDVCIVKLNIPVNPAHNGDDGNMGFPAGITDTVNDLPAEGLAVKPPFAGDHQIGIL